MKYSNEEIHNIIFLQKIRNIDVKNVFILKKEQEKTTLTTKQYEEWIKLVGNGSNIRKLINFKLSIRGQDVMAMGYKGTEIAPKIQELETNRFLQLNENPDEIALPRLNSDGSDSGFVNKIRWSGQDSRAFGYIGKEMFITTDSDTHGDLAQTIGQFHPELRKHLSTLDRPDFKYAGRLFLRSKIITFWEFPTAARFKKVLSDIENASTSPRVKLWNNGWRIEVVDKGGKIYRPKKGNWRGKKMGNWRVDASDIFGKSMPNATVKFIPVEEYVGSEKQTGRNIAHMDSPMGKIAKFPPEMIPVQAKKFGTIQQKDLMRKGLGDNTNKKGKVLNEVNIGGMQNMLSDLQKYVPTIPTSIQKLNDLLRKGGNRVNGSLKNWHEYYGATFVSQEKGFKLVSLDKLDFQKSLPTDVAEYAKKYNLNSLILGSYYKFLLEAYPNYRFEEKIGLLPSN
jgi:hypothetical protein